MELSLDPKTQRFVDEQVRGGGYATPQDVVREALARMEAEELAPTTTPDAQAWAAIDRAQAEFDAGLDRPFEDVADELRAKYLK